VDINASSRRGSEDLPRVPRISYCIIQCATMGRGEVCDQGDDCSEGLPHLIPNVGSCRFKLKVIILEL
jgi:hypothetical protein